jgi:type IV pilus assembly protein PilC
MAAAYRYTARDAHGKFVAGGMECGDEESALAKLRSRALYVTLIMPADSAPGAVLTLCFRRRIPAGAMAWFYASFAALVRAGITISRALRILHDQCADAGLRETLAAVAADISDGMPLSESFEKHADAFSVLSGAMVRAGELSGRLDEVLGRLAVTAQRDLALRKRTRSSLLYPAIVAAAALGVVAFLLVSVVPMFQAMYGQMRVPLPAITQVLVALSAFLRSPWIIAGAGVLTAAAWCAARFARAGIWPVERTLLAIPLAGKVLRDVNQARISRLLGMMLGAGVGIVPALDLTARSTDSRLFSETMSGGVSALRSGSSLSTTLQSSGLYDPLFVQMLRVGEETGRVDDALRHLAEYYDGEVDLTLTTLASAVEPLLILFLGSCVAFIVAAILIPLYALIGSIR